jgi:glycosyltransferase involved in cell wall biosynthesis
MKILYATRLFSSLEKSFSSKKWDPSGVPTIYRVIEEIDKNHDPCFLFMAKDNGRGCFSSWNNSKNQDISVSGLKNNVSVISGVDFFPMWMGRRFKIVLREIRQSFFFIVKVIRFKPDIIYCDHANVLIGGLLSRIQKKIPVVFRVMGIDSFMRQCLIPNSLIQIIYKWIYRSPFALILCTQDGSGVEAWADNALIDTGKKEILLNGTDVFTLPNIIDQRLLNIPDNKLIILFVGKLEMYKGCYEFVQSIFLLKENHNNIHALVIGIGSEGSLLKKIVLENNANEYFTFINELPNSQIFAAHSISDIYVSMNHFGNLSNANLEAIQSNDCMIISKLQVDIDIDIITNILFKGAVINTPIQDPISLSNAIAELINSEKKRLCMSHSLSVVKKDFIWSWEERIDREIDLLKSVMNNKKNIQGL